MTKKHMTCKVVKSQVQKQSVTKQNITPIINVRPTTHPNDNAGPAGDGQEIRNKTPKKRLGKRTQNLSPQTTHRTQTQSKKKKVTDDDLAALEAQNMMQSGSRQRSKPTQRK